MYVCTSSSGLTLKMTNTSIRDPKFIDLKNVIDFVISLIAYYFSNFPLLEDAYEAKFVYVDSSKVNKVYTFSKSLEQL